ncbi:B3/B4 domain-containing protein [Deinococcus hopiensis]|uniref:B3/B4 domain-containing protein (DNA/RNA-binding domain of Phe-tRNA-synthetase) n=1 Tax=Deinococcus hopiensis KR-140 TaxID=695939 RepID=A0A1W1UAS4_9DEIO|nr:phenylalanine--tRNA ligase beta subunit-related protein [Deinococcus hopiensis]SMB78153.1 B3/B4 domain-containing protein (DNA/RNA-binding domain of Phe-tRNA-synthetase) [Deinococcus hopiensis KR-140]
MNDLFHISPAVAERFPTYRGLVLLASGLTNGPSDARSLALLRKAEEHARQMFATMPPAEHPHLAAWQEAFRAFGVKPKRTMNSAEALIARVLKGGQLPAINRLADAYNAVSVRFAIPCGGEDLAHVVRPVTLRVADGTEPFETNKDGAPFTDYPAPGEVVWADEAGVTCRAWNWRQGTRTRLTEGTQEAYFLFDALPPMTAEELERAGDVLEALLAELSPGCRITRVHLGSAG